MKVVFKGFLRTVAQEVQNGASRITTGKLPLSFGMYCEIFKWMMDDTTAAGRFAHLFLVLRQEINERPFDVLPVLRKKCYSTAGRRASTF